MSRTVLSLCYSPIKSNQYDTTIIQGNSSNDHSNLSLIQELCNKVMSRHRSCHIAILNNDTSSASSSTPDSTAVSTANPSNRQAKAIAPPKSTFNITITGPPDTVMMARTALLQACPLEIQLKLKIPIKDLPATFTDPACHNAIFERIRSETEARLALILPTPNQQSYFESANIIGLSIVGLPYQAELARVRLLVALDDLAGLHTDMLRIPRKLHYLLCGRKRATLQPIIDETLVNIYFPSPFTNNDSTSASSYNDENLDNDKPPIFITGDATSIARSKEMLTKLAHQKAKSIYYKITNLDPRKLDWMQVNRRDELHQIMHDNGSFVALPPLGSTHNNVTVFAENRVNAERTLRSINFLACHIYEACFYFHDHEGLYADTNFFNSVNNLATLTTTLSQISGTEATYQTDTGCIQVFGTEHDIRNVYQRLHETSFLKVYHHNTIFNVELSNDQREFISGKKNGKINKIMKTSGAKIKFLPYGEYNFILEVESSNFVKALDGLTLLQEELPAEISFYVPETYHKRIIGVGGKNIQRIMKKYGVYVKFSNAEEFASLGGYYGNEDNVVARTPMKNQVNLDNLRQAVTPKDKDFMVQIFSIPFRRHRSILIDYKVYLQEVSKKTSVKIIWSSHELASDVVTLVGPQCDLESAIQMLRHMVSDVYCFRMPLSSQLISVLSSTAFEEQVVLRIQKEMDIVVDAKSIMKSNDTRGGGGQQSSIESHSTSPSSSSSSSLSSSCTGATPTSPESNHGSNPDPSRSDDCVLPFRMNLAHLDFLPAALDTVIRYFKKNHVPLFKDVNNDLSGNSMGSNGGSLTPGDYSNHLKSKLLSSFLPSDLSSPAATMPFDNAVNDSKNDYLVYSLFDYPSSSGGSGNGMAAPWKTPQDENNIRAIFDSPYDTNERDSRLNLLSGPTSPTQLNGYMNGLSGNHGGLVSHSTSTSNSNLDVWLNPYSGFQNSFSPIGSPPLTSTNPNVPVDQSPNLLYDGNDSSFYFQGYNAPMIGGNGLAQRLANSKASVGDYRGMYIQPTSSTSSRSDNSLNSTKSMPEPSMDLHQRSFQTRLQQAQDASSVPTTVPASLTISPPFSSTKSFRPEGSLSSAHQRGHINGPDHPPSLLRSSRSSGVTPQHHHNYYPPEYQYQSQQYHGQHHRLISHQYLQQQQQQISPPYLPYSPHSAKTFSLSHSSSATINQTHLPRPLLSSSSTPTIPMTPTTVLPSSSNTTSNIVGSGNLARTSTGMRDNKEMAMGYSSLYSPIKESDFDSLLSKISLGSPDQENTMGSGFDQYHSNQQRH